MNGRPLQDTLGTKRIAEQELRDQGDVWADHVLENVRAYIMTFFYIFVCVISGYPLAWAIAFGAGMEESSDWIYAIRTIDAAIFFWLPQINVFLLRLVQRRNLYHRMTQRTVVIGDVPWVAQAAEAFLSKIFAVSYSIAGINVLSGNPTDHFVHRHTHRVVRGTLLICGRPDGRLSSLSTAEQACCLSVNQASSIQSLGGCAESITIGHNPFKLPLTIRGIFLKRKRPLFLCERLLLESDINQEGKTQTPSASPSAAANDERSSGLSRMTNWISRRPAEEPFFDLSLSRGSSVRPRVHRHRSAAALLSTLKNLENQKQSNHTENIKRSPEKKESFRPPVFGEENDDDEKAAFDPLSVDAVVAEAIEERRYSDRARKLFQAFDLDNDGLLDLEEFLKGAQLMVGKNGRTQDQLRELFALFDAEGSGTLDYKEFYALMEASDLAQGIKLPSSHRDARGLIQIEPSREKYFGELLRKYNAGKKGHALDFTVARNQETAMLLYESRIASLQRFVAMVVLFHQMGSRVEQFFDRLSFGFWSYRMDRTHSIMRIATTASPISGADVLQQMRELQLKKKVHHAIKVIWSAYRNYKNKKIDSTNQAAVATATIVPEETQEANKRHEVE